MQHSDLDAMFTDTNVPGLNRGKDNPIPEQTREECVQILRHMHHTAEWLVDKNNGFSVDNAQVDASAKSCLEAALHAIDAALGG